MRTQRISATAAAIVLALGLTACGEDDDDRADDPTSQQTPSGASTPTDGATDQAQQGSGTVDAASVDAALAAITAAEEHAGGTAYEISEEDGGWEVDVAVDGRHHEVRIDASGGVAGSQEDGDLDGDDRDGMDAATLTLAEAIEAAVASAPGGRLDGADLDREGDGHAWEVTFDDGGLDHEVYVDVASGEIVRTGSDD